MKSIRLRPLSFLLLVLVLGGCAPHPPLPAPAGPGVFREWLPALRERTEHWQRYQARIHLKAESAEKRFSLDAVILANLPAQVRLEAFRMGQTVGVLILNQGQASLFVPSEKMLLSAARSEDLTNHLLGIALPVDRFGACLSAIVFPAQLDGFEVVPRQREWLGIARSSPDDWSSVWHFSAEPQALTSLTIQQGAWDYAVRYDPPVGLAADEVPRKITFTSAQWRIEADVQELKPVAELNQTAFQTDFGREIRRVEVRREE